MSCLSLIPLALQDFNRTILSPTLQTLFLNVYNGLSVGRVVRDIRIMAHSHCTEPGLGMGPWTGTVGFYIICCTVDTALRQGQEPDPLSPIVLVPSHVPFSVPCSVNKPLNKLIRIGRKTCFLQKRESVSNWISTCWKHDIKYCFPCLLSAISNYRH